MDGSSRLFGCQIWFSAGREVFVRVGHANSRRASVGARYTCGEVIESQSSVLKRLAGAFFAVSNTYEAAGSV